jgi:hypothetical protein
MRKDTPSTINRIMDKVTRMVSNFAVRFVFSLSLMKVSMLATRLARIRINKTKMMILISIVL